MYGMCAGGHTAEMLTLVGELDKERYSPRTYIVAATDSLGPQKALSAEGLSPSAEVCAQLTAVAFISFSDPFLSHREHMGMPGSSPHLLDVRAACFALTWALREDITNTSIDTMPDYVGMYAEEVESRCIDQCKHNGQIVRANLMGRCSASMLGSFSRSTQLAHKLMHMHP